MTQASDRVTELEAEIKQLKAENHKLRASNRRWMRIAGTDSLTGLPNKVFFTTALLPQAISTANAESHPLGCLMMAPDKLWDYNARYGRKAGDQIIQGVSAFLQDNVEGPEKLVHVDGANFVLMVPRGDLKALKRRRLTLRARLLNRQFDCVDTQVALTLSYGAVARAPSPAGNKADVRETVEAFLRRLAAALDQAKQAGGDSSYEDSETEF